MKLNTLFAVNTVVGLAFGIGLLLVPAMLLSLYGAATGDTGILLARLLGAEFIGYNLVTWLARRISDRAARRNIVLARFLSESFAFMAALVAQLAGVLNVMGWSVVAVYLLLALGYAYYQFFKPNA